MKARFLDQDLAVRAVPGNPEATTPVMTFEVECTLPEYYSRRNSGTLLDGAIKAVQECDNPPTFRRTDWDVDRDWQYVDGRVYTIVDAHPA